MRAISTYLLLACATTTAGWHAAAALRAPMHRPLVSTLSRRTVVRPVIVAQEAAALPALPGVVPDQEGEKTDKDFLVCVNDRYVAANEASSDLWCAGSCIPDGCPKDAQEACKCDDDAHGDGDGPVQEGDMREVDYSCLTEALREEQKSYHLQAAERQLKACIAVLHACNHSSRNPKSRIYPNPNPDPPTSMN